MTGSYKCIVFGTFECATRGVQICHRRKSYDRFTIDFTTDFSPIIDKNSVVNLWLSIFESVIRTTDFFPMIDKKSVVNLWLIFRSEFSKKDLRTAESV